LTLFPDILVGARDIGCSVTPVAKPFPAGMEEGEADRAEL